MEENEFVRYFNEALPAEIGKFNDAIKQFSDCAASAASKKMEAARAAKPKRTRR